MARTAPLPTVRCHILVKEKGKIKESFRWKDIDTENNVVIKQYLPDEEAQPYIDKMMKNTGEHMSDYYTNHPESPIWNKNKGA